MNARLVGVCLLAAACQSAPNAQSVEAVVDFNSYESGSEGPLPMQVTRSGSSARLSGTIETPNPCFDLHAELSSNASEPTLRIIARPQDGICVQIIGSFNYSADLSDLAPGVSELVVVYDYPGSGWDTQTIRVPVAP